MAGKKLIGFSSGNCGVLFVADGRLKAPIEIRRFHRFRIGAFPPDLVPKTNLHA